jgi:hypothetical protein
MKRLRSTSAAFARTAALLAVASAQLWCATNDDSPSQVPPEPPPDASILDAPRPDETSVANPLPPCTSAFCRVALPGSGVVALNGVFARTASDVWVVGSAGFAAHYDGSAWMRIDTRSNQSLFAVWGSPNGPVWATNAGNAFFLLDRPSTDGGVEGADGGWKSIVTAISGTASGEAYAVGSVSSTSIFGGETLTGDNIWRYTPPLPGSDAGSSWTPASPECTYFGPLGCVVLQAVWVQSARIQFFAGQNGKIYRTDTSDAGADSGTSDSGATDGGSANRIRLVEMNSSSLRTLDGLWGFGENDVWAVGAQGAIRHWVGGEAWVVVPSPVTEDLHAVWGSRPDDVWAVGDDGVALHWDGKAWSVAPTPFGDTNRPRLYAVSGTGADVWIAGESTLLRASASSAADDGGAP